MKKIFILTAEPSGDKLASKVTLAVLLGEERARLLALFTVILSGFIPTVTYFLKPNAYLLLPALTPLLFLKNWNLYVLVNIYWTNI